jgi:hypothetical protein
LTDFSVTSFTDDDEVSAPIGEPDLYFFDHLALFIAAVCAFPADLPPRVQAALRKSFWAPASGLVIPISPVRLRQTAAAWTNAGL